MTLKWTMDSAWAAIAVIAGLGGGAMAVAESWGASNAQIVALQQHQAEQDQQIDANSKMLSDQKAHDAAVEQKLDDVIGRLNAIDQDLKHGR